MATITTRSGKGSALTHTELDNNFSNLNSDKVEASGDTITGNLNFQDNAKAQFGTTNDLQIYHDGTRSYIDENGTGDLWLRAENLFLRDIGNKNYLKGTSDAQVELFYNGVTKLTTTSTGIDVTGTVTADTLGIGTTSPQQKLDITSAGTQRIQIKNTNLTSSGFYVAEDSTGAQLNELGAYPMRFHVNGSERMRINSSGRLLVGTTQSDVYNSSSAQGVILANDHIQVAGTGSAAYLNRLSSDGAIIQFRKDGATVGSIGVNNNDIYIGTGDTSLTFVDGSDTISPTGSNGAQRSDTVSLGDVNNRFKDLYLSGDVNLANNSVITFASTACAIEGNSSGADYIKFTTNSSEGFRLDSSGNLLVSKTSAAIGTVGVQLEAAGSIAATRDGGNTARFNRLSSDGDIATFHKDGTTVGSIGSFSGSKVYIGSPSSAGAVFATNGVMPVTDGSLADNAHDLGQSTARWKDLYLSGGAYLGGTAAANKLDDYEEGTWTPTFTGSTSGSLTGFTVNGAIYTKIGDVVHAYCFLTGIDMTTSTITGNYVLGGLPMTATSNRQLVVVSFCDMFNFDEADISISGYAAADTIVLRKGSSITAVSSSDESANVNARIQLGITYRTTA